MGLFTSKSESTSRPLLWQENAIRKGFDEGSQLLDRGLEGYSGDRVADMTADQRQLIAGVTGFAGGQGGSVVDLLLNNAGTGLGGLTDAVSMARQGAGGTTAAMNAGPDMGMVGGMINNPVIAAQIDAASRDVSRNLYENQLPGIAGSSAATGNLGSSRRGAAEAIATRGAADRMGDIAAGIRSNAYGQALGIGANAAAQNTSNQQNANLANLSALFQSSGQLGNMAQLGAGLAGQGVGTYLGNQQAALGAQGMLQGQQQNEITADQAAFMEQQMLPWQALNMYHGITGGQLYGGTQTNTQQQAMGPALLKAAGSIGAAALTGGASLPFTGAAAAAGAPTGVGIGQLAAGMGGSNPFGMQMPAPWPGG